MTRVAVVTGGAGAIGGAIARRLAADGHTVVVLDRDGGLGADGIAVAAVAPGLTPTPAAREGVPAEVFAAVRARQALARDLEPDDVARTVAFLAGEGGAALTGQVLCVDGGLVLR
jgi:NAD(P)-dependent dehydrogenase (short-subunit alcohol dehydrogenase family)